MSPGRRGWLAAAVVVLLAACGQPGDRPQQSSQSAPPSPGEAVVHVTGHGVDEGNAAICEDFRLTDAQAQEFFGKAHSITAAELHDDYDVLPCWVEGATTGASATSRWKIRAGGTAEVTAANGDVSYLGCKTCDDILQ